MEFIFSLFYFRGDIYIGLVNYVSSIRRGEDTNINLKSLPKICENVSVTNNARYFGCFFCDE